MMAIKSIELHRKSFDQTRDQVAVRRSDLSKLLYSATPDHSKRMIKFKDVFCLSLHTV